jgi:hypothetical protein
MRWTTGFGRADAANSAGGYFLIYFVLFDPFIFSSASVGKLREIEILCQDPEDGAPAETSADAAEFKKGVLAILYATDDNAEFQVPEEGAAAGEEAEADDQGLLAEDELQE